MLRKITGASVFGFDHKPGVLSSLIGRTPAFSSTLSVMRGTKHYCMLDVRDVVPGWPGTAQELVDHLREKQFTTPIRLAVLRDGRVVWWYRDECYSDSDNRDPDDVKALLDARHIKERRAIDRARSLVQTSGVVPTGREPISDETKTFVWQRDGGRCVKCQTNKDLEFDHIIPVSMGGANTARNLQLLCQGCNREKGGNLV